MPELPEVETIRRGLRKKILRKKILRVEVRLPKIVRPDGNVARLQRALTGKYFTDVLRRGKLLALPVAASTQSLLIHLKMTGQLIWRSDGEVIAGGHPTSLDKLRGAAGVRLPDKYTHVILAFQGGSQLFFNDLRQFGYFQLVSEEARRLIWVTFGVEPFDRAWSWQRLRDVLRTRTASVKAVLLDQAAVAGLGNIYADEVLWRARVHPARPAEQLELREVKRLATVIPAVLRQAVAVGGTTFSDYRTVEDTHGRFARFLRVYDRVGQRCARVECRRAGAVIEKIRVAGRGTHYCPRCQV